MVADTLQSQFGSDVYRYGGEEFCAIFENMHPEDAKAKANRARRVLSERIFFIRTDKTAKRSKEKRGQNTTGTQVQVTISIGLAGPTDKNSTPHDVIQKADMALYKAKENGRNRVEIS